MAGLGSDPLSASWLFVGRSAELAEKPGQRLHRCIGFRSGASDLLSISLPWFSHTHTPFSVELCSSAVKPPVPRGPPAAAL
jgi:hypothetical protein